MMGAPFHYALLDYYIRASSTGTTFSFFVMGIVSLYNYIQGVYYG